MIADTPRIFELETGTFNDACTWIDNGANCYMLWDGLPVKLIDNKPWIWRADDWVEADYLVKSEQKYFEGVDASLNIPAFRRDENHLNDGRYTLLNTAGENPYGVMISMLIPDDFYVLNLNCPLTVNDLRAFLEAHELTYGILFTGAEGQRGYITRKDLGLSWPTKDALKLFKKIQVA